MSENDDMLPVALMNARTRGVYFLVDKHNDHLADFDQELDDHECQRIVDLINANDAALRRAKAEVLELAARELCMYCNDPGNWAPMSNSGYHQCNTPGPNMTRCGATKIHALRRELDARAAQIEEGE